MINCVNYFNGLSNGFLISPEEAKNEKLRRASEDTVVNAAIANKNLRSIAVLTNLEYSEMKGFMAQTSGRELKPDIFEFENGLNVCWQTKGKYCVANLFGNTDSQTLQSAGEDLFQTIDGLAQRNVRLLNSNEYFYFNYETSYTSLKDIYAQLKKKTPNISIRPLILKLLQRSRVRM